MKKYHIILDYSRLKISDFVAKVDNVIEKMTGNAHFPDPAPTLAVIEEALEALRVAASKAVDGSSADRTNRETLRNVLDNKFRDLGHYVIIKADNDLAILQSSGFELKKESVRRGILDKPNNFVANPAKKIGAVDLSCHTVAGAKMYQFEYTEFPVTDKSIWQTIVHPRSRLLIENLESAKHYAFRVKAMGSDPTHVYSNLVHTIVL